MAKITLQIPTPLRPFIDNKKTIACDAKTIGELFTSLSQLHPELTANIIDNNGHLRHFVNIFVDGENIQQLAQFNTILQDGQTIAIIPAVSGGHCE